MIPLREENVVAIDLITQHIRMKLQQPDLRRIYHNLEVVPSNYQTRGMHTIIRDVKTNKTDFVFYADRLLRLVSHWVVIEQTWISSIVTCDTASYCVKTTCSCCKCNEHAQVQHHMSCRLPYISYVLVYGAIAT